MARLLPAMTALAGRAPLDACTLARKVRVVSAGPDGADGRVRVEIGPDGTLFIMR